MLDSKTRAFFAKSVFFDCPNCSCVRIVKLNDLGQKVACQKCGHLIEVQNKLEIDLEDDELRKDIEEYIKEIKDSSFL